MVAAGAACVAEGIAALSSWVARSHALIPTAAAIAAMPVARGRGTVIERHVIRSRGAWAVAGGGARVTLVPRSSRKRPAQRAKPPAAEAAAVAPAAAALRFDDRLAVALAFVGSGCLLILEIVAGRLVAPVVGVSLYTWTSVIGVVLAGITIGNYLGGRLADYRPSRSTVALIYLAASAASLSILGLVHVIDSLELPSGAPAILQVLWINLVLFLVPRVLAPPRPC